MYNLTQITYNDIADHINAPIQTVSLDPYTGHYLTEWWIVGNSTPSSTTLYGAGTRVTLAPDDAGVTIYALIPSPLIL